MYVCICLALTESDVRKGAVYVDATHYACVMKGMDICCKCIPRIKEIIHEEHEKASKSTE